MSLVHRVLAVLATADTPLSTSSIMAKSGVDRSSLGNTLTRLAQAGRITKQGHGMYFMTPAQRAEVPYLIPPAPQPAKFCLGISAADLSRRLHFLINISQRPAFEGHAILGEIIKDYRRALDRVTGQEDSNNG